jgi:hypothetical protein
MKWKPFEKLAELLEPNRVPSQHTHVECTCGHSFTTVLKGTLMTPCPRCFRAEWQHWRPLQ